MKCEKGIDRLSSPDLKWIDSEERWELDVQVATVHDFGQQLPSAIVASVFRWRLSFLPSIVGGRYQARD